jgi:hypothetical protein
MLRILIIAHVLPPARLRMRCTGRARSLNRRSFGSLLNCLLRQTRRNVFGGFAQDDRAFFFC